MTTFNRRSFMNYAAAVPAVALVPAIAAAHPPLAPWYKPQIISVATQETADPELDALWAEILEIKAEYSSVDAAIGAAIENLPAWAARGEKYVDFEGKRCGGIVGWPEAENLSLPSIPGAYLRARVGPSDIKKDFEQSVARFCPDTPFGQEHRAEFRAQYRARMQTFIGRLRQQRAEEAKLGIDELEARREALADRLEVLEIKIFGLPRTPNTTVAELLMRAAFDFDSTPRELTIDADSASMAVIAMHGLRPFLTGAMANMVAEILDHPDRPLCELGFWTNS